MLKNGVEIPAFVEQLTPWRSIDNPSVDGQSVRVARIQVPYTFTALNPETITVQWGGVARTLNRTTLQDPRIEWHTVTSGTFVAADNVEEPDVLPVLPKAYLAKGMLDARTDPTANGVAETRDDPAVMDAMTFSGYTEYDYAEKNFFYTIINQNPGITINYKTQAEPWLYDRASGMYELYLRSGFATALREAVRSHGLLCRPHQRVRLFHIVVGRSEVRVQRIARLHLLAAWRQPNAGPDLDGGERPQWHGQSLDADFEFLDRAERGLQAAGERDRLRGDGRRDVQNECADDRQRFRLASERRRRAVAG